MSTPVRVMGWGTIVTIMIATGIAVGVLLGLLRDALGITNGTAGVGASVGVVGALLISRRRIALRDQQGSTRG